ncbi:hypothetical protein M3484_01895 [Pseudomonas sp. GX19020]|uniref:hypothetical protein n=1 Tax=Pseudomonas sp. GX19020 TaxID=2942277 RepID=UPI0020194742|nr:hypothetical protein [Pseudomonas sp. GX19020]MCL4065328.1 hypothetical protein [Pseudomonas sp. GX19020]
MESDALKAGKERVRKHLIEPLTARGLKRAGGSTVAQHEATMEGLAARLAYMSSENLGALADVVERHGQGKHKDRWPSEVVICNWARQLQEPPPSDSRFVTTYLRSRVGRQALAEGWAVELYLSIKKFGQPPNGFVIRTLKEEADASKRRRGRIETESRFGTVAPADRQWLEWYHLVEARVAAIMDAQDAEGDAA